MTNHVDGKGPFEVGSCVSVLAWRFDEREKHNEDRWRYGLMHDA